MCFCKRYQSTCIQSISYTLVNPAVMQLSASSDVCVCGGGGGGGEFKDSHNPIMKQTKYSELQMSSTTEEQI